jgi:hypothetical protein
MKECSICYSKNTKQPFQVACVNEHSFHINCIKDYYRFGNEFSCPLCRGEMLPINKYNLRLTETRFERLENKTYRHIKSVEDTFIAFKNLVLSYELEDSLRGRIYTLYEMFCFVKKYGWIMEIESDEIYKRVVNYMRNGCKTKPVKKNTLEEKYVDKIHIWCNDILLN